MAARAKFVVQSGTAKGGIIEGPFSTLQAAENYALELERIFGDQTVIISVYPPKTFRKLRTMQPLKGVRR